MSRLKWLERYNCHSVSIAPGLNLQINWSVTRDRKWDAYVFGEKFKQDFAEFEEAEQAVIDKAKELLRSALDKLEKAKP